jgi:hypothetical protein
LEDGRLSDQKRPGGGIMLTDRERRRREMLLRTLIEMPEEVFRMFVSWNLCLNPDDLRYSLPVESRAAVLALKEAAHAYTENLE